MFGAICLYPLLAIRELRTDGSIDKSLDVGSWGGVLPGWEYFGIGVTDYAQWIMDMVRPKHDINLKGEIALT
jgi:hypothetical protein